MLNRRITRIIVPVVVAGLALAACSSSKKTATPAASSGGSAAAASGGSKPTFTIGYEGPLSGGDAQLGLNEKYAVELAINEANATGALPFTLKYAEADDQGSGTISPASAQQLIGNKSVIAVVGPAFSGATAAAEPFYAQANLATVSPSATRVSLATSNWASFYRVIADDSLQGPADGDYAAKKLGAKTIYSIDDASSYGQPLEAAFETQAKADGATLTHQSVPGTTQCQEGTGNVQQYPAVATAVKSAAPDLVYYAGYYCGFALLSKALNAAGYTGKVMSTDGALDPKYVSEAGASVANNAYISCACAQPTGTAAATDFTTKFKALAGFASSTYSPEAFDATNAIIAVLKSLGTTATRQGVETGLKTVDYQGISKEVKFQPNGNIFGTAVFMYQVQNGVIVSLGQTTS